MSTDIELYVPLKTIVSYTMDENDKSDGDFDKFWVLSFRALVDMLFEVTAEPITLRLPVNGNKTVDFPSDYLMWTKIGILTDKGEVSALRINNALTTFKDNNPNRLTQIKGDIDEGLPLLINSPFYVNYFYDGMYQPLFGVGGGLIQFGGCRVDENNRVVILEPDFKYTSIIFEYISSPQKNDDYTVPITAQEAIIAFIKWKAKLGPRAEYYAAKVEARRRMPKKKVTLQGISQVLRESEAMKLRS